MSEKRPAAAPSGDWQGRYALVAGRFNAGIVDKLVQGAREALLEAGIGSDDIQVFRVPGAFELPQAVKRISLTNTFDAVVALGAVIRGGTPHFDYVCQACAGGLSGVALESECPVTFGVLTADNEDQATARAGGEHGNKGADAARAALEMVALYRRIKA